MAVETRYVVIRTDKSNKEQDVMTFTDKRAADEYDKMLDMADDMFELLQQSGVKVDDQQAEELSIFLAKQREDVLIALQAKKKPVTKKPKAKSDTQADLVDTADESEKNEQANNAKKTESELQSDAHSDESEDNLIDFVIEKDDAA
ncbi:YebG family protein [Psychrosphaera aestuarii]|uniref:YebG family protein n=1 Tax=Psychrosphaera aestuarii TaxID=1266052 RepID=UPI001B32FD0B|nr:YebG family protein [Psychrosphaera aestuarii]